MRVNQAWGIHAERSSCKAKSTLGTWRDFVERIKQQKAQLARKLGRFRGPGEEEQGADVPLQVRDVGQQELSDVRHVRVHHQKKRR